MRMYKTCIVPVQYVNLPCNSYLRESANPIPANVISRYLIIKFWTGIRLAVSHASTVTPPTTEREQNTIPNLRICHHNVETVLLRTVPVAYHHIKTNRTPTVRYGACAQVDLITAQKSKHSEHDKTSKNSLLHIIIQQLLSSSHTHYQKRKGNNGYVDATTNRSSKIRQCR